MDVLEDDPEGHQEAALAYYAALRGGARSEAAIFSLPTGEQVCLILLVGRELWELSIFIRKCSVGERVSQS